MSIEMSCGECKQKMYRGVIEHLGTCSGNLSKPISGIDYIRPPVTVIKFSSKKERARWLQNINSGCGGELKFRMIVPQGKDENA